MSAETELADEIMDFLSRHARTSPAWDPDLDDPSERYTGPDPCLMGKAARQLREGIPAPVPWSSWSSGCYSPMNDVAARQLHDALKARIAALETGPAPSP